jgi:perosamine synthetase
MGSSLSSPEVQLIFKVRDFFPVNEPLLDGTEKKYLSECIDTGWISSEGPFVKRLEKGVALSTDREHGIAVCNGSAALEVAVAALHLGPGDEVILPTFTIVSCANPIIRAGATPVVIDADPVTWNIDVRQAEEHITSRTRAIMAVHTYGLPVDMDPLLDLASKYGLKVIEDAAEAIGQTYRGRPCGSFGDISVLSFYPNKHITTGEGGMMLTDDASLAERCRSLRNLCFGSKRFVHQEMGWNFRMSNVQAALGVAQLEQLDKFIAQKRAMGALYQGGLKDIGVIQLPAASTNYAENIYWVFGVVLNDEVSFGASVAMDRLTGRGIGTRPFFWPMHEQPVFQNMGLFQGVRCPVAERLARRGFYLPSGLALTPADIEVIVTKVREALLTN